MARTSEAGRSGPTGPSGATPAGGLDEQAFRRTVLALPAASGTALLARGLG